MLTNKQVYLNLMVFGFTHACVDAACIALTTLYGRYGTNLDFDRIFFVIMLYNIIAFGLQPFVGEMIDRSEHPRRAAAIGCAMTAAAVLLFDFSKLLMICLAGLGNAVFHTGAGSLCLNLRPGQTAPSGIFVAPGTMGLYIGLLLGSNGKFDGQYFAILLMVLAVVISLLKTPEIDYSKTIRSKDFSLIREFLILITFAIAVRALIGFCVTFPWKTDKTLLFILTLAVVLGKGVGGILADRFGRISVATWSLLISAPLISFASDYPFAAIAGMFLFNFAMPVTLVAIADVLPGKPAFAFGITCLALIVGAFPTFFSFSAPIKNADFIFASVVLAAFAVYYGLRKLHKITGSEVAG